MDYFLLAVIVVCWTVWCIVDRRERAKEYVAAKQAQAASLRKRVTDEADRIRQTESSADRPS
jgi:hypothetical protein